MKSKKMRRKHAPLTIFEWRLRQAFVKLAFFALLGGLTSQAHAISVSGVSFSNTSITYQDANVPNGTTVSFTIDSPGLVTIDITKVANFGDTGIQVASVQTLFPTSGAKTVFWDGMWLMGGERGRINGLYQFTLSLSTGSSSASTTSPTLITINSVDIHGITATPTLDGAGQPTYPYIVTYALAKESRVTAKIYNSSDTLVRTLLDNRLQAGESISTHTLSWNGLSDSGSVSPIGVYTLKMDAVDPAHGGTAIQRTRTLTITSLAGATIDVQTQFENNIFVYPNPIRDNQGIFQYQAIRDGATITLKIYTISGDLVLSKNFGTVPVGTVQQFVWDATNDAGNRVGRGLYFYVFREEDSQGTLQTVKKLAVIR